MQRKRERSERCWRSCDAEAKQINASRSKWAATAIDAYLHQKCITGDAEVMQMKDQVMQLQQPLDAKTQECDARSQKITHLDDEMTKRDDDLDRLKQQPTVTSYKRLLRSGTMMLHGFAIMIMLPN